MITSKLIERIKRRVTMPANQRLIDDDAILEICDDVIMERIVPEILSLRQNFFVTSSDIPLVVNQDAYKIPYRSIGRTLRDLKLKYSDGSKRNLSLISLEDEHYFSQNASIPTSFYFKGDKIILVPAPSDALTLEMWWEMSPSKLVLEDTAAVITSIISDDITVSSIPSGITTSTDVDLIEGKAGHSTYAYDLDVTAIVGNTLSFATGTMANYDVTVGDYISLVETTPVIQLPNECNIFLETLAARRVLQAIGDFEGLKVLGEDESEDIKQMRRLLEPRIRGEATKIINRNGLLRGMRRNSRGAF